MNQRLAHSQESCCDSHGAKEYETKRLKYSGSWGGQTGPTIAFKVLPKKIPCSIFYRS
jgi:hypothetical protein